MSSTTPSTRLLLIEEAAGSSAASRRPDYANLRQQLSALPGFDAVELTPYGQSTVFATVPARNQRDRDRLKALVDEKVHGWRVLEEQNYSLPTTF